MSAAETTFWPLGDGAVRLAFGERPEPGTHRRVEALCRALEARPLPGVSEWVPGYVTVTVYYRPERVRYAEVCRRLAERLAESGPEPGAQARLLSVPVCYGGRCGPDLGSVAAATGLSADEVVARHSAVTYRVRMLGFAPGFPYLSGLDARLVVPRLERPRPAVPPGSVGIGGEQTGVYPISTPGGWRLIGRTPVAFFDSRRADPFLVRLGDRLRFVPVDPARFRQRLAAATPEAAGLDIRLVDGTDA